MRDRQVAQAARAGHVGGQAVAAQQFRAGRCLADEQVLVAIAGILAERVLREAERAGRAARIGKIGGVDTRQPVGLAKVQLLLPDQEEDHRRVRGVGAEIGRFPVRPAGHVGKDREQGDILARAALAGAFELQVVRRNPQLQVVDTQDDEIAARRRRDLFLQEIRRGRGEIVEQHKRRQRRRHQENAQGNQPAGALADRAVGIGIRHLRVQARLERVVRAILNIAGVTIRRDRGHAAPICFTAWRRCRAVPVPIFPEPVFRSRTHRNGTATAQIGANREAWRLHP